MENNQLTTNTEFAIAQFTPDASEQLAGITLEFPQLKIPSAGSTFFDIDDEPVKEILGVIVSHGPRNVYYATEFDGSSNPPDCFSNDGITGHRREDDESYTDCECAKCEYAVFGSGKDGKGKACKEKHLMYILTSGRVLPFAFLLPVSSASVLNTYATKLFTQGRYLNQVLTSFTLEKATNKAGIVYSKIVMKKVRDLTPEELEACAKVNEMVRSMNG